MAGITAIVTAYRRANCIQPLVESIRAQTVPASQVWIWANAPTPLVAGAIAQVEVDRVVTSSANTYFHARFALALTAPTEFVAVFDDDSVPGAKWLENCFATFERTPGILGAAGVRLVEANYATATKHGWHEPSVRALAVDLVGHAWFLRTRWLHYLFAEPAVCGTNGEDIELAARAMRFGAIPCYCPPHPPEDRRLWGSTRGEEFGTDANASFRRVSHVAERDHIVRTEIAAGWRPLFMRSERTMAVTGSRAIPLPGASHDEEVNPPAPEERPPSAATTDKRSLPELLSLIPESVERVLHIGCGDGLLGEMLKNRQSASVVGIERDPSLASVAKDRIDTLVVGDFLRQNSGFSPEQFDCVVCEQLDQVRDPLHMLRVVRTCLKRDGALIVRVPNIRHVSVVEAIIQGRWQSRDGHGTRRPLRLFTRREIEKLFFRAGFATSELRAVPGRGYAEWDEAGRPGDIRVGQLHVGGMKPAEAEEFYTEAYLAKLTPEPTRDFGLTSIVLITHNELEYTRRCLESIFERTDEPYELILVDNASTDGTVDYIRSIPDAKVIENNENRGFPAAANQGIAAAGGNQILLLNNDALVTTGWLRRMLRALRSDPRIGLVGACSNFVSGSQQVTVSYDELEGMDGFAWDFGKSRDGVLADTDRVVGFCLLMRREVVEKIGQLDERFGMGNFEDDDYTRRAVDAGFRAVIARDAFVHHFGGRTFLGSGVAFANLIRENQNRYQQKLRAEAVQKYNRSLPAEAPARGQGNGKPKYEVDRVQLSPAERLGSAMHERDDDLGSACARASLGSGLLLSRAAIRLSACIIMRNNERTIASCIESMRPWVDEINCVDTGSTDRTADIARRFGARIFHFPWCDSFSAARNESFCHARGRWIFWMDTDDTIDAKNGRAMRRLAIEDDPAFMAYMMKVYCPGTGDDGQPEVTAVDQVKLVRNLPEICWDRRIHEQLIPAIRRVGGEIAMTELFVVHSGSDQSDEGRRQKLERDLRLLKLELKEFPDHPFTLFNLGMTYRDARDYEKAVNYLKRSIERSGEAESHLRKAYALLVSSYRHWHKPADAFRVCQDGLRLFPDDAELRFLEAGLFTDSGQFRNAAESYRRVLEIEEQPHFASIERGIRGYLTRHNLAVVYSELGEFEQAEKQWQLALDEAPMFRPAWRQLGAMLLRQRKFDKASELIDRLESDERLRCEAMILLGSLAAARGDVVRARHLLEQAATSYPSDPEPLRALSQLLLDYFEPSEAEGVLKELVALDAEDPSASHNLGTLYLRTGRPCEAIEPYRASLRLRPDQATTWMQLGYALKESRQTEEARAAFEEVIRITPDTPAGNEAKRHVRELREAS